MKKRFSKIILLVLSLALLVGGAISISVSADTTAPKIISKNVKADGNFSLMFAIDPATVTGEDVTVTIYNQDPTGLEGDPLTAATVQTITKAATATTTEDLDGDGTADDEIIVIETKGVAAKDIADVWYIVTESNGVKSDVTTYSVKEYAFERLYKDGTVNATEGKAYYQKEFYLDILEIGSSAQELLVNYPNSTDERLANEYIYVYVKNGTFEELGADRGFVEEGTTLTIVANDGASVPAWQVNTYNKYGVLGDSQTCSLGSKVTVAGNTVVIPDPTFGTTPGSYYDDIGDPLYSFNGITSVWGKTALKHESSGRYYLNYANATDISTFDTKPNGINYYGYHSITEAVDTSHGKVLEIAKEAIRKPGWFIPVSDSTTDGNSNCVVFEADVFFDESSKVYYNYEGREYTDGVYGYQSFYMSFLNTPIATTEDADGDGILWESGERTENTGVNDNTIVASRGLYAMTAEENTTAGTYSNYTYKSSTDTLTLSSTTDAYVGTPESLRVGGTDASTDLELGTWYNLCMELTNTSLKIYINGELVYTSNVNCDISTVQTFAIQLMDRFTTSVQLDNVICTKVYK